MRIAILLLSFFFAAPAFSQSTMEEYYKIHGKPWYDMEVMPTTLKGALREDVRFLGADNAGFKMKGNAEVCAVMSSVKLGCDYNTRTTLSLFLTVNEKGLFTKDGKRDKDVIDYYSGGGDQNKVLLAAIKRNLKLFKDGDLSAEAVKKSWK